MKWSTEYLILVVASLKSLFSTVFTHELGHWIVAKYYGLKPKMAFGEQGSDAFMRVIHLATTKQQDKLIALAGPVFNLIVGFLALGLFLYRFKSKKWDIINKGILIFAVLNLIVGFSNLIPALSSDARVIFG